MDDALRAVLAAEPRVAYALVFGSDAAGRATSFSDLDVAIGLEPGTTLDSHALGGLIASLERAAGRPLDLAVLDEAPAPLAYRAFRDGRLIFERNRDARVRRLARAILDYLDFQPVERLCARGALTAASRG